MNRSGRRLRPTDGFIAAATVIVVVAIAGSASLFGWGEVFVHPAFSITIGLVAALLFLVALAMFYRRYVRRGSTDNSDEEDRPDRESS